MSRAGTTNRSESAAIAGGIILSVFLLALFVGPAIVSAFGWSAGKPGLEQELHVLRLLGFTIGIAALIAVGAAVLGLPAGLWIARRGWRAASWMIGGMLMPTTLAYAGWGLVRAPGTALGDWLERFGEHGHQGAVVFAGRALAVVALILWSFPIAAVVTGLMLRRVDRGVFDSVRLEAAGPIQRSLALAHLAFPASVSGALVVFVLMLGSAVPLHLAQMPTLAVELWKMMDTTPQDAWWRVWLAGWPIVALAAGAAWVIARQVRRGLDATGQTDQAAGESGSPQNEGWGASGWLSMLLIAASVVAPAIMLAASVRNAASFSRFWTVSGGALADSSLVAAITGVCGVLLTLSAAATASSRGIGGWVCRAAVGVFAWSAVMPGVLIGALLARGYAGLWARWLTDEAPFVAFGHIARFGILALLVGCWSARAEARAQRDLRSIDGAGSPIGYLRAALPVHLPAALIAGIAMAAMSLHEIESSVILQPPGVENFAKQVLQMLHFSRMEELSVAVTYLVLIGGGLAIIAGWLAGRVGDRLQSGAGRTSGR